MAGVGSLVCSAFPLPERPMAFHHRVMSAMPLLLRQLPRGLDDAPGTGAVLLQEAGEHVGWVEHRLEADLDQALAAKLGIAADGGDLPVELRDDGLRRARRRDQGEIGL